MNVLCSLDFWLWTSNFDFQLDDEETGGAEYTGPIHEINLEALEGQEMEIDDKLATQKEQRVPATNGVADDGKHTQ